MNRNNTLKHEHNDVVILYIRNGYCNTFFARKCIKNIRLLNIFDVSYTITGCLLQIFLQNLLIISDC